MNARNLILVALIVLVGGGAAFLFLGEDDSPGPVAPGANSRRDDPSEEPSRGATRSADGVARTDVALDPSDPQAAALARDLEGLADREAMALTGRVVDTAGAPVVGAEVALRTRIDPRRFFENGGARGFDPGNFDLRGGRGGRGGGQDFRDLFRGAVAADPVVTDGQGRFRFDAKAYRSGTLELTVDHDRFAPASVRRDWEDDEKDVELEPIVLNAGVRVTGNVVDANGNSVVGAAVTLASANGGFGGFGGGRGGRGGRGGSPFGGDDSLLELVDSAETDATGHFVIDHVPAGQIRVRAEMAGHLPSESDRKDGEDGATLDVGVIELGPGAVLRGVVVDAYGNPIEGAEVVATVSRDAAFSELRELPEEIQQELRRAMGRFMGARQETETDADGRFELDMVPDRAVRLEVDHPDYISRVEEPVEPLSTPNVQLTLAETLGLSGRIVDAATGAPVETFGIRARQVRDFGGFGGLGGRQQRGGPGGQDDPQRAAEFEARIAEFQADQEREQAKVQQLVGGSGLIPGRTPDPEGHTGGRFDVDGLQPGTYVLDIDAPGYVKIAAGRYELSADAASPADLTIQLERGTTVTGMVVDADNGVAIANARVSLEVPREQDGSVTNDIRNGMRAMFGGRGGRGGGGMSLQAVRTDRDGRFEFAPTRPGNYALSVEAEGFPGIEGRAFPVPGNTPTHDVRITMDNGARVFGNVLGLEEGQRARVVFTQVDGSERRTADVDVESSSYEIEGLLAGGYRVRVEMRGGDGGDFRARIGQALAERMDDQPDLFVPASGEIRYDVGAEGSELGKIEGRVFRNGNPGTGLEVRLAAVEDPNDDPARRLLGRMSRMLSARVDEQGNFELSSVPPGQYFIEVYAGGGGGGRGGRGGGPQLRFGGGNGAALIRQPISVMAGQTVPQVLSVDTGAVALRFVDTEGKPVGRARVELVRADESAGVEPAQWRDLPSHYSTGLRNGALEIETAPVGTWKYSMQVGGGQPVLGEILVTPGVTTEAEVQVPATQGGN